MDAVANAMIVKDGTCHALYAYDVGLAIDLNECDRRITSMKQRTRVKHKRRAPASYFEYESPPLRILKETGVEVVGSVSTQGTVELVIHDFGAVTVIYAFPMSGPLSNWVEFSVQLCGNDTLRLASRREVEALLDDIREAVTRPRVADIVEDYMIYEIRALAAPLAPPEIHTDFAVPLAQMLRSESSPLSDEEVQDALACRLSFGPDDLAIVDWNASIVFDRDADDVRTVLELGNAELLEMRFLDEQLDRALEQSYEAMVVRQPASRWSQATRLKADLKRIARLQVDSAILFERINNALKLFGDQYLARVYQLASQRFHLNDWDSSILRKLQTLDSIYQKLNDQTATRRMEVLEWIIILLIAISIVLPFITPGH